MDIKKGLHGKSRKNLMDNQPFESVLEAQNLPFFGFLALGAGKRQLILYKTKKTLSFVSLYCKAPNHSTKDLGGILQRQFFNGVGAWGFPSRVAPLKSSRRGSKPKTIFLPSQFRCSIIADGFYTFSDPHTTAAHYISVVNFFIIQRIRVE
jgi:hypothetical protein